MKCTVGLFFLVGAAAMAQAQTPCEQLRSLASPYHDHGGGICAGGIAASSPGPAAPPAPLPAHCRVAAILAPSPDSHIEMEIWLPPAESWNGKFQAVGNGGWAGNIAFGTANPQPIGRTMSSALKEGYAAASTTRGTRAGARTPPLP